MPQQGSIAKRLVPGPCLGEANELEVKRRRLPQGGRPLPTPEGTASSVPGGDDRQAREDPRKQQILNWICTGQHRIQDDYVKPPPGSEQSVQFNQDDNDCDADSTDQETSSTISSAPLLDRLVGADDDLLIPTPAAIDRVFRDGRATWTRFLNLARSLPPLRFPPGFGDPSIMLKDVPALPAELPRKGCLVGRPLWRIPDPEKSVMACDETLDMQYSHGPRKFLYCSYPKPVECCLYSTPHLSGHELSYTQRGLPVLVMCWSYIFSVRLLELQGRRALYSPHSLLPVSAKAFKTTPSTAALHLGTSASRRLVRWLCAILAPQPGWSADTGDFPPWAAFCSGDTAFAIVTVNGPTDLTASEPPPCSAEATELLIEFCEIYGFLRPPQSTKTCSELPPASAAFFATLSLPFYRQDALQPRFPVPSLSRRENGTPVIENPRSADGIGVATSAMAESTRIRQYTTDLRYYMTLSMDTRSLGSVVWSIFWQPDIEANLVSPWLSSIKHVLNPLLASRDLAKLINVFAFRRPRVASWWLGIFLLGDFTILDRISRYLDTLEERWGYASVSHPDIAVAAWTGSPQSFLDDEALRPYTDPEEPISRSDLLQHRHNFFLQDEMSVPLSWRPFGHVAKEFVEPDIWPWLDRGHVREYVHWVWWVKRGKHLLRDVQLGFRQDTGRFVANVPDHLETVRGRGRISSTEVIKLEPSMESTLRMLGDFIMEVNGDRDRCLLAIPGATDHPWLKDWRGRE
ncbi:hypothetical protein F5144DRAFT_297029 [Chaetomium tenue]|uniref:Uncharacterized protein n=1 Tax=Chaetomium tenue TaxID=1854479 RepID=A0ACB7P4J8_9PEZI|nr:hypothetical protein F5144DRAFT_297029 [Chaetomium globosum]